MMSKIKHVALNHPMYNRLYH